MSVATASSNRVLLIGDADGQLRAALSQAMPAADVTSVPSVFDGIAELCDEAGRATHAAGSSHGRFATVLAAAEPIERRPEAAVKTLRQLAAGGRLLLFGHPTLEPLTRKMLAFGADDYVITPTTPAELLQALGASPLKLVDSEAATPETSVADDLVDEDQPDPEPRPTLPQISLADIVLDAQVQHPHEPVAAAVRHVNRALGAGYSVRLTSPAHANTDDAARSHPIRVGTSTVATLHFDTPADIDDLDARHMLAQLSHLLGKLWTLQDRHNQLQKLAITDELTGLYNGRYFRHFLSRILDKAKSLRFPVTLLLFDIDDFKKYNDRFGHTVGDEILKQTATLMKRCVREHDCVARISGDEFAVVFWEKDGPRQLKPDAASNVGQPGRPPQTPVQIFERFRGLISAEDLSGLGASGRGILTISGGLAVYPYDAQTADALYDAADKALMFGSKKCGKDTVFLVGSDDPTMPPPT